MGSHGLWDKGRAKTDFSYMAVSGGTDLPTKALSFCHQCCWWTGPHCAVHLDWSVVPPSSRPQRSRSQGSMGHQLHFSFQGLPQLSPSVIFFMLSGGQGGTELLFFCFEEGWGPEAWVHGGRPGSLKTVFSDGKSKGEWCCLLSGD